MAITLPAGAEPLLAHVGVEWPEVDEDVLAECQRAWGRWFGVAKDQRRDSDHAIATMEATNRSDGLTEFVRWWGRVGTEQGHLLLFAGIAQAMEMSLVASQAQIVVMKSAVLGCLPSMRLIYMSETVDFGPGADELVDAGTAAAYQQVEALKASMDIWLTVLSKLGVPVAGAEGLALGALAKVIRSRPIHASRERVQWHQRPIQERLASAQVWTGRGSSGKFPAWASPCAVLKRVDPQTGMVTNYAVYDAQGKIVRRVDLTGNAHPSAQRRDVPTPHTQFYSFNQHEGRYFISPDPDARPATPEEIP
ncbi:polymorphic toxin type 24 domain-containing protein [Auraticoccus monumenti]|uniref:Toxin 24 n=1 Tax=Auraticoccus monumenti TaxID=675864 RepID=A0A1G6TEC4_9ACTN|nr:polymorphic toxin type 24 domain-containing protein [Auraticoccus monumenti]SDD27428.1 toxin 24 [Auraticoccus monumenti]